MRSKLTSLNIRLRSMNPSSAVVLISNSSEVSRLNFVIRDFLASDTDAVNRLAVAAFEEFRTAYSDWMGMVAHISNMSTLAAVGELMVVDCNGMIIAAVICVALDRLKAELFKSGWPRVRRRVNEPKYRGKDMGG